MDDNLILYSRAKDNIWTNKHIANNKEKNIMKKKKVVLIKDSA